MKSKLSIIGLPLALVAILGLALAGDLEPPGPPAPTMKTLQQVEPRTPLSGPAPITITSAGSYYLTEQVVVSAGDGIVIAADNVDLDLRGFSLSGTFASGTVGIRVNTGNIKTVIHDGQISAMERGIVFEGNNGLSDVRGMLVTQVVNRAFEITDGFNIQIIDCHTDGGSGPILIANSNDIRVHRNLIVGGQIGLTTFFSDVDISDNTFMTNGAAAIFPSQNVTGLISGNRIIDTDETAIFLGDQVNMAVTGNIIQRAGLSGPGKGIDANSLSTQGTIVNNEIYDTAQYGIESASTQITISGNIVGKSGIAGYNVVAGPRIAPVVSLSSNPGSRANVDSDLP